MIRPSRTAQRAVLAMVTMLVVSALGAAITTRQAAGDPTAASTTIKQVTRTDTGADGATREVDSKTVSMSVSETNGLRGRQRVTVTWHGAHPTGGRAPDPVGTSGALQEYPFLLMQCRGTEAADVPATQRLSQGSCWTQTPSDRYTENNNSANPPWRLDHDASDADRQADAGRPTRVPAGCPTPLTRHWLPFIAADERAYNSSTAPDTCGGSAPEAGFDTPQPSNTIFGFTDARGDGTALFEMRSSAENASLGCTKSVPCSLVAIPIMGISCDAGRTHTEPAGRSSDAAVGACRSSGRYAPGDQLSSNAGDQAVSGGLWWSASNWRNRMVVPLTFAPAANACDITDTRTPTDLYGSELFAQASQQWAPAFCADPKRFKFRHIKLGEPAARNLLDAGTVSTALTTRPPEGGFAKPTLVAPIAVTGFAVGYAIDKPDGSAFTSLKMTPRLLAKLLSESYPANGFVQGQDEALKSNPQNISFDPEFRALNPGLARVSGAETEAPATLASLSTDSDVVHALTAYIDADPEARAWLDGQPDPWGMTVNPAYKRIALPVDNWPLLDSFEPDFGDGGNDCYKADPSPYLGLVAAPTGTLANIAVSLLYSRPFAATLCPGPGQPLKRQAAQPSGSRFIFGLASLPDADRSLLSVASLQSYVEPAAPAKFDDATGRNFVAPSDASLRAAVATAQYDAASGTWPISSSTLRNDRGNAAAYPGTLTIYAAAPASGLSDTEASHIAQFLRYSAADGQRPGNDVGQLPPGYLPLTAANGLAGYADRGRLVADQLEGKTSTSTAVSGAGGPSGAGVTAPGGPPPSSKAAASTRRRASAPTSPPSQAPGSTSRPATPAARAAAEPGAGGVAPAPAGDRLVGPAPASGAAAPAPETIRASRIGAGATPVAATAATPGVKAGPLAALFPLLALIAAGSGLLVPVVRRRGRLRT